MPKKPTAKADTKQTKATKKATKKSTKKAAQTETKGTKKVSPNGLTPTQLKILGSLKATVNGKKEMSSGDIREATGLNKGLSKAIGTPSKDEVSAESLLGKKLVTANKYEGSRGWQFAITDKGKKALQDEK